MISVFLLPCGFSPHAAAQDMPDCNIDSGPCTKRIGASEIILDITPRPVKVMKELSFTVTLRGKTADRLILDLGMPGMYMGKNKVVLKKTADDTYKGKGVIPKCPSGRKLWRATVYLPDAGNNKKADFIFNVSY
ncbi:MAG: hypothetical protein A2X55_00830 [Nitrospirae bacterium GWB2_47_37]|nr:MAG: hypothetical protein A2Z82_08490 [Nitrospirae bacterium GWA2_46_11]OGW25409.1 MAG: hypothetical protein A2X55_00830 [Nitrospirae bacterium GWB2_47_37]